MSMLLEINHTGIQNVKEIYYIFSSRIVQFITATACLCLIKEWTAYLTMINHNSSSSPKPHYPLLVWPCENSGFQEGNLCTVSYIINH